MPCLIDSFLIWMLIGRFAGSKDIFAVDIPFTATTEINRFSVNH